MTVSAANMWVTVFILIMQVGVAVTLMQVVSSAVHYAHMLITVSVVTMQMTGSVKAM